MDESHKYWFSEYSIPGVNEILKSLGLVNTDYYTDIGAERGKRRHLLLEAYDDETLDWATVEPEDNYILVGYKEFLDETGYVNKANELPVHHPILWYAGTLDKIGEMAERPTVIDIKTGSSVGAWAKIQVALYAMAYAVSFDTDVPDMGILHLREAKKKQYSYKPVESVYLESAEAIVEAYHWQQGNKAVIKSIQQKRTSWVDDMAERLGEVI